MVSKSATVVFTTASFWLLLGRQTTEAVFCDDIDAIKYGDVLASQKSPYRVGTILTFECDKGFKGHGKGSITCMKDGRWSDPVPYCTAYQCRKNRRKVEEGRKCRKVCETDSDCKGTFKKCLCDDWCGKSCFNPDADCPALIPPSNGYIIGSERSYGYAVTYGCEDGYILTGPATRRCRSDRKWSGYEPKCVAFSTCGQPGDKEKTLFSGKVIEGTDAKVGAWPWQALLFHNYENDVDQIYNRQAGFGGGSIIDDNWILTAAHVFDIFPGLFENKNWQQKFLVAVGITSYPDPGQVIPNHVNIFEPEAVYRHAQYDSENYDYDVSLIRIGKRLKRVGKKFVVDSSSPDGVFTFSRYIRPVCLPCMKGDDPLGAVDILKNFDQNKCSPRGRSFLPALLNAGNRVMVTGFGWKRNTGENVQFRPKKLQEGLLKIIDDLSCAESVKRIQKEISVARFTNRMLCAGSINETSKIDSCQGDSGGPLVKRLDITEHTKYWLLVGIVSWGWGCGNEHPGYYTSVTSIMSWVWKILDDTQIGTWYNWAPWTVCSRTCGGGSQHRIRICETKNCQGSSKEETRCNPRSCPTGIQCPKVQAPSFGSMVMTPSSKYFSIGTKVEFSCTKGKYLKEGPTAINCLDTGKWSDKRKPVCEDEWDPWTSWGACTATCNGARYKTRVCRRGTDLVTRVLGCTGPTILYAKCNTNVCQTDSECGGDGKLCLQGDINVNSDDALTHIGNLLGTWLGGKK